MRSEDAPSALMPMKPCTSAGSRVHTGQLFSVRRRSVLEVCCCEVCGWMVTQQRLRPVGLVEVGLACSVVMGAGYRRLWWPRRISNTNTVLLSTAK